MPSNNQVNAGSSRNVRPLQDAGPTARSVAGRMVHHDNLPVRAGLFHRLGEPRLLIGPEFVEPLHAILWVGRPCGRAGFGVSAVRRGVQSGLAVFAWVARVGAKVVIRIVHGVLGIQDVRIQEEEVHAERLEVGCAAPVLCRHHPATTLLEGVVDLLVPALDVAHTAIIMISQHAPPLDVANILHRVHLLKDLRELGLGESRIMRRAIIAMRVDAARVKVVANVKHKFRRLALALQLLRLLLHAGGNQVLRHPINGLLKRSAVTVRHRIRLSLELWV
mmetsp:Transcript_18179/g.34122  ORF Transcript_18179/g.34122 Transcript_18179/m.34122 type:complete len:277 (+) Transcript_18179:397-1227(+)